MSNWNPKANEIFLDVQDCESPERRRAILDEACGTDGELRDQVESLLAADMSAPSILDRHAVELTFNGEHIDRVGSQIGPYKIRELIGEGGMGEVYVAEQERPVRRKVALKIIRPGMATKDVVARFEAERQALAMMDHPNIAKVFDAGTVGQAFQPAAPTDQFAFDGDWQAGKPAPQLGPPYFVMELVQGVPITEYCDQKRLTTRERLQLFVSVCRAVQHAHQKGIIHRDLKPSNVLVPEIDGAAVPKVIDFGVAKATSAKLTERTVYTQFSQLVGTPLYMSPEQAGQGVIDIDTRSDVYSLGVLLYELLTGSTPFDRETLKRADYDELRRIIREDQPRRPSAMVSTLAAKALSTVAERRRSDPRTLSSSLSGELDWLVMKALEKDRGRRYESAAALAEDVERYLADEPVLARPPSTAYRVRKFVRRNRALVASLTAVLVALALGAAVATAGFLDAIKQRDIARDSEELAQRRLAEATEAQEATEKAISLFSEVFITGWGREVESERLTVREAMEEMASGLDEALQGVPKVEIRLRQMIASSYRRTSDHAKAREHLSRALELAKGVYGGEEHEAVADLYIELADELQWNEEEPTNRQILGDYARKALKIHETLGIRNNRTGHAWFCLSLALTKPEEQAEGEACLRKAFSIAEELAGKAEERNRVFARLDLASHLCSSSPADFAIAHKLFNEAAELSRKLPGDNRTLTATVLANQGKSYRLQGDKVGENGAIRCYEEAWDIYSSPDLNKETRGHIYALNLAELYVITGQREKAEEVVEQVETICRDNGLDESWADLYLFKAWSHSLREDYAAAEQDLRKSLDHVESFFPERHPMVACTCFQLAEALRHQGKDDEARSYYRKVLTITGLYVDMGQVAFLPYYMHAISLIYGDHPDKPRLEEALEIAEEAHQYAANWPRPLPWVEPHLYLAMALAQYKLGQTEDAVASLEEGLAKCEPFPSLHATRAYFGGGPSLPFPTSRRELEVTLAEYLADGGRVDEACDVYEEGVTDRKADFGDDHLQVALAELRYGAFLVQHEKYEDAESQLKTAYEKLHGKPGAAARAAELLRDLCKSTDRPDESAKWRAIGDELNRH